MIALPFIILFVCMLPMHGFVSWAPILVIMPIIIADIIIDFKFTSVRSDAFIHDNLVDTANKLLKVKKYTRYQFMIGMALMLPWLVWIGFDEWSHISSDEVQSLWWMLALGILIGALAGVAIALAITRRMQRDRQAVIDQINELTKEENDASAISFDLSE